MPRLMHATYHPSYRPSEEDDETSEAYSSSRGSQYLMPLSQQQQPSTTAARHRSSSSSPSKHAKNLGSKVLEQLSPLIAQLRILQQRRAAERAAWSKQQQNNGLGVGSDGNNLSELAVEDCVICCEPLTTPESSVTGCGHVFHTDCILRCFPLNQIHSDCPICRRIIHRVELIVLHNGLPSSSSNQNNDNNDDNDCIEDKYKNEDIIDLVSSNSPSSPSPSPSPSLSPTTNHNIKNNENRTGDELDTSIKAILCTLNLHLTTCASSYISKKSKLDSEYEQKKQQLKDDYTYRLDDVNKQRTKLSDERRGVQKTQTEINKLKDRLVCENQELKERISELNEKRNQVVMKEKELESKEKEIDLQQVQLSDQKFKLKQREEQIQRLYASASVKRKRVVNNHEGDLSPITTPNHSNKRSRLEGDSNNEDGDDDNDDDDDDVVEDARRESITKQKLHHKAFTAATTTSSKSASVLKSTLTTHSFFPVRDSLHTPPKINRPTAPRTGRARGTGTAYGLGARNSLTSLLGSNGPSAQKSAQKKLKPIGQSLYRR